MSTSNRHILFLCSWFPNKNARTLGNFVQKHAEAAALYNKVSVIAIFSHDSAKYEVNHSYENNVDTYVCYYPKVKYLPFGIKQLVQRKRTKKVFKIAFEESKAINGMPKIVHLNQIFPMGQFALYLLSKFNIPYVITENSTAYHLGNKGLPSWALRFAVHCMKKAAKILPVSKDLQNAFLRLGIDTPMEIIPNVVNEAIFGNLPKLQAKTTRFIHISTAVDAHKNISGMLRSIKNLSTITNNFNFLIVSDGNTTPFIKMAYEELKIPKNLLQFEGTKTTTEVATAINESSAFVLFSNYENLPCVILEALTVGKPVISTHVNGVPECIDNTNGILIEPKNEAQLTAAMLAIIKGEKVFDYDKIRTNAIKKYSYQAVGKAFSKIYDEVLLSKQ